jgi:hypothetical protein
MNKKQLLIGMALGYWVIPKLIVMLYDLPPLLKKNK